MMFMNRSRFPWMPRPALAAKSESPIVTTRVSGFAGASAAGGLAASVAPDAADTAVPIETGPFLSPVDSSSETLPEVSRDRMSLSAQLRGPVSRIVCATWPLTPPITGVDRSRQRKRGEEVEPLGDRMWRIARHHRHRRVGAEHPSHAAHVDDDVVADVRSPSRGPARRGS